MGTGGGAKFAVGYLLREPVDAGAVAAGNLISWPAFNSTFGAMPFSLATSSAESLLEAAILAIVSPLRARTLFRVPAFGVSAVPRFQLVNRTLVFGTTSFVVVFRSTPLFMAWSVATLTPVRLATDCRSSPGATEITR